MLIGGSFVKKQIAIFIIIIFAATFFVACDTSRSDANQNDQADHVSSMCVIDAIMSSYSCRSFGKGVVPDEIIEILLNAGQKAPSAGNAQPWHFTVIKNTEIAQQVAPRHYAEGALVIVISGKPDARRPNVEIFDSASASQNIYLAAQAFGLGVRQYINGVQEVNDNMRESLGIPEGYNAIIIMMIGYPDYGPDAISTASPRRPVESNVNFID